jgi:transposase
MAKRLVFVGIDVAQATLEVAVRPTGESWQRANDEVAFGDLIERIRQLKPTLIVLEATGGIHLTGGCGAGCGKAASRGSQSQTGARFRKGHRQIGQY